MSSASTPETIASPPETVASTGGDPIRLCDATSGLGQRVIRRLPSWPEDHRRRLAIAEPAHEPLVVFVDTVEDLRCGVGRSVLVVHAGRRGADDYRTAIDAGACGMVDVEAPAEVVAAAVQAASQGLVVLPAWAAREMVRRLADPPPGLDLSQQDQVLLAATESGLPMSQVAASIGRSERHTRRLLKSLWTQLHAANRSQAIANAARWGLVP